MSSKSYDARLKLGGTFMTLIVSCSPYMIRNLQEYVDTYFWETERHFRDLKQYTFLILYNSMFILGMMLGSVLFIHLKLNKLLLFLALLIQISGLWGAIKSHDFFQISIIYTTLSSLGGGINAILSLQYLWEHFPDRKGWIAGYVFSIYWLGSYLLTLLSDFMLNAHNKEHRQPVKPQEYSQICRAPNTPIPEDQKHVPE